MALTLTLGDVLAQPADALLLTLDGAAPGMEGRLARAFGRRWPEAWALVAEEIPLPMGLGETADVALPADSGAPFRGVVLAATLHHAQPLDDRGKRAVVRTAVEAALKLCAENGWASLACPILSGGWRLREEDALPAMLAGHDAAGTSVELRLRVLDAAVFARLSALAAALGIAR
jgi:hypothetical protein